MALMNSEDGWAVIQDACDDIDAAVLVGELRSNRLDMGLESLCGLGFGAAEGTLRKVRIRQPS